MTMIPTLAADSGPAMHAPDAELDKIQHTPWCRLRILVGLIVLLAGMPTKAALLTFQDIPIPGSTESAQFPTVTFTGTRAGGTTVAESFTITISPGTAAFQSFAFTGFSNLQSVTWGQPICTAGIHQFTNIELLAPVPERSARLLIATGFGMLLIVRRRLAARSSRAISFSQNGPTPDNRNWSFS